MSLSQPTPDREAVLGLLQEEIAGTPVPRNLSPLGCTVFLGAIGLFFALSILTVRWSLGVLARSAIFFVIVAGLITGLGLVFMGGGRGRSRARRRAADALDHLASRFATAPPRENLEAAVRLVWNAFYSVGPWVIATLDAGAARDRLRESGALALVHDVERIMMEAGKTRPLFTQQ